MNISESIKLFNENALEFMIKMEQWFPEEKDISYYKLAFVGLRSIDFTQPVGMFMTNLEPYGLQIMTKDENFFKTDQFIDSAESISGKMGLIKYWDNLPNYRKEAIWDYMQILYVLGMQSLNKLEKLKIVIDKAKGN